MSRMYERGCSRDLALTHPPFSRRQTKGMNRRIGTAQITTTKKGDLVAVLAEHHGKSYL